MPHSRMQVRLTAPIPHARYGADRTTAAREPPRNPALVINSNAAYTPWLAVTLSLGIIINLYSALVGTKVIFDIINSKWKLEKLSI